jgi:hypothetical protein
MTEHPDNCTCFMCAKRLRGELAQLRRAWALHMITVQGWQEHDVRDFAESEGIPESVAVLIRAGAGCPIGECGICGQRAPLQRRQRAEEDGQFATYESVCAPAWGCSEKGASDGG